MAVAARTPLDGFSRNSLRPGGNCDRAMENRESMNLRDRRADVPKGARNDALAAFGKPLDQQEVDQCNQSRRHAGDDQGVIGAEVVLHVK